MMSPNKKLLPLILLILVAAAGFSQSNEIRIRFIANCGLHITDGKTNIYIDFPYKSGAYNMYSEYDKSEVSNIKDTSVFIFTHKHWDHYSRKIVKKLKGEVYTPWNIKKLKRLNASVSDFSIESFKTRHKLILKHRSYLITWHGKRIFISGDTEHAETIAALTGMDWAFAPAWLLVDATRKNLKIDTKMVGLYHIGPGDAITTDNPKIHLMTRPGEVISIPY